MADREIVQQCEQLLETVRELSGQMENRNQSPRNVNSEVARVFGRASASSASASHEQGCSQPQQGTSRFRRLMNMRRIGNGVNRNRSRTSRPKSERTPFLCDLVLLSGPDSNIVPRQGAKVLLMEKGHVLSACRFSKDMNEVQVETTIMEAFADIIPPLVDMEILTSVHSKLVKPTLAPGQTGINGIILHRLFKNKPAYVRPSRVLLPDFLQVRLIFMAQFRGVGVVNLPVPLQFHWETVISDG